MAEEEKTEAIRPAIPTARVKKIVKIDKDINKVNSEALFLISCSAELFLRFLAGKSAGVAMEKKRKTVNLDHLRVAVKRHQPTSDFVLDSLPAPTQNVDRVARSEMVAEKPAPVGTRRIDDFFNKSKTLAESS